MVDDKGWDIGASNARENDYWSQVEFPEMWVCPTCGLRKDEHQQRRRMGETTPHNQHAWVEWVKRTDFTPITPLA